MAVECNYSSLGVHQSNQNCRFPYIHTSGTHGYFASVAGFSKATFFIFTDWCLQVGHCGTIGQQILQMLWPFAHSMIGGLMYSIHTGHSSWLKGIRSTLVNWGCMLDATRCSGSRNVKTFVSWKYEELKFW